MNKTTKPKFQNYGSVTFRKILIKQACRTILRGIPYIVSLKHPTFVNYYYQYNVSLLSDQFSRDLDIRKGPAIKQEDRELMT